MKPTIVHISNDYPDPLKRDKTQAIKNLVEATPEFRHVVYSLNRTNGVGGQAVIPFGVDRTAIAYHALPKGLFWKNRLEAIADWIAADLREKNIIPSLIQAHKLTVEGLAGYKLAEEFSCPLICDIQGGTDIRILKAKLNLRAHFKKIAQRSAVIFPYAPWVVPVFEKTFGVGQRKYINLPVLPGFDTLAPSPTRGENKLVTLMRFDDRANKNITGTMEAIKSLKEKHPNLTLDIYGGGCVAGLMELTGAVKKMGLSEQVFFKGPIDNAKLPKILGSYSALVMPSFMETYGLVYAEALFCGLPVIYSKGRAIDGYFDPQKIGYACDPSSIEDITTATHHILTNEESLKTSIAALQENGGLNTVRRDHIIETYRSHIKQALN